MLKQIEGSRALPEAVAMCRPQVICAYPITPQTHIVEALSAMVKKDELAAEFLNVESEFAAMSVAGGDMVPSERTVTVAIGHSKKAARSIDAFLRGAGSQAAGKHAPASFGALNTWYYADAPATVRPRLEAARRITTFRRGDRRP